VAIKTVWPVEHSCEHEQDHDLRDKRPSERAGFARWLATKECSDCWRANRDKADGKVREAWLAERRAEEAGQIKAWERRAEMPVLDGSEKAVEWGRRVRFQLMCSAYQHAPDNVTQDNGAAENDFVVGTEVPARKVTSASWWIDQRDTDPADVSELVADAASDPTADTGTENPFRWRPGSTTTILANWLRPSRTCLACDPTSGQATSPVPMGTSDTRSGSQWQQTAFRRCRSLARPRPPRPPGQVSMWPEHLRALPPLPRGQVPPATPRSSPSSQDRSREHRPAGGWSRDPDRLGCSSRATPPRGRSPAHRIRHP